MSATRRRLARTALALVAAASVLGLSACGVGEGSAIEIQPGDTIKVGIVPTSAAAPMYIAMDQGYFADEGLNVEVQIAQNAAAVAPSVLNGQLQFGFAAASPFIGAVSKGLPLYAVANSSSNSYDGSDETGLVTPAASDIERPRDLEGRTVAVNGLAALPHVAAMEAIALDGGDPTKVTFVAMPFPDMLGAMKQGRIDAAALAEPFYSQSQANGDRHLTTLYATAFEPGSTTTLYFTAGPFIDTNPEVVKGFRNAINRAAEDASKEPQLVRDVLVKYAGMNPDAAATMGLPTYSSDLTPDGLEQISSVMAKYGLIKHAIVGTEVVYP